MGEKLPDEHPHFEDQYDQCIERESIGARAGNAGADQPKPWQAEMAEDQGIIARRVEEDWNIDIPHPAIGTSSIKQVYYNCHRRLCVTY